MKASDLIENENLQNDRLKLQQIANKYGIENQMIQAIEEMAELIQALCKQWKSKNTEPSQNIMEETADVTIMLKQLTYLFDCQKQVDNYKNIKINRQIERMRGHI
jgi:NTP pyrophosphatase (non-canonical NTP hydrolase)